MRYMKTLIAGLTIVTMPVYASAQQEIILDHVTNAIGDSLLVAGNTHILNIRYRNLPPSNCFDATFALSNGFRLSSPDGANWNRSLGFFTQELINAPIVNWIALYEFHFEDPSLGGDPPEGPNDGVSPDYLFFGAAPAPCIPCALPAGYDEITVQIEIETNLSDTGKQICIDPWTAPRMPRWGWAGFARGECNVVPGWGGPYCFTIVANCCQGATGNIDFDHAGIVDIADLTLLIDHLFINFPVLPCSEAANLNGSPDGRVDISDLTVLIDHLFINFPPLPACQ